MNYTEVTHKHNEALLLIDGKIKNLILTMEHISDKVGAYGGSELITQLDYIVNRIKSLKKTKDLLLVSDNSFEEVLLKK